MTESEMLQEIRQEIMQEIVSLRAEIENSTKPILSTQEACEVLKIKDARVLTYFHRQGLLSRHGGQKGGHKYLRAEVQVLQAKLLGGLVRMPKHTELRNN